jgi:hypothetical protein
MEQQKNHIWERYIKPQVLLEQIEQTAPFLFQKSIDAGSAIKQDIRGERKEGRLIAFDQHPYMFLDILESSRDFENQTRTLVEELEDYFALCCSAHQATVMTFVPTDVDSKIRGILWNEAKGESLSKMLAFTFAMKEWAVEGISTRYVKHPTLGYLSGHDGEWFSVASGGCGRLLQLKREEEAESLAQKIDEELWREIRIFDAFCRKPGHEIDALKAAFAICHNLGDLDQGLSYWEPDCKKHPIFERFQKLAHDNIKGYQGYFPYIVSLYKEYLSAEGHRNYPLRAVKPLRKSAMLLLPFGPFLDDWGLNIAQTKDLNNLEKSEVMDALIKGCKKVNQQEGYYRALAGWYEGNQAQFNQCFELLSNSSKKLYKESEFRQKISISKRSFESIYLKRVEKLRKDLPHISI